MALFLTSCLGSEPLPSEQEDPHPRRGLSAPSPESLEQARSLSEEVPTLRLHYSSVGPFPLWVRVQEGTLSDALGVAPLDLTLSDSREAQAQSMARAWTETWSRLASLYGMRPTPHPFSTPTPLPSVSPQSVSTEPPAAEFQWKIGAQDIRFQTECASNCGAGWARASLYLNASPLLGAFALLHWVELNATGTPTSDPSRRRLHLREVIVRVPHFENTPLSGTRSSGDSGNAAPAQNFRNLQTQEYSTPDQVQPSQLIPQGGQQTDSPESLFFPPRPFFRELPLFLDPANSFGARWIQIRRPGYPASIEESDRRFESLVSVTDSQGNILLQWDETPSALSTAPVDWYPQSTPSDLRARNFRQERTAFPSRIQSPLSEPLPNTRGPYDQAVSYSGFGVQLTATQTVTVSIYDLGHDSNRARIPLQPSAISCNRSPCQWDEEPQWGEPQTAVTGLANHLKQTLEWYATNLRRNSWDNLGGPVHAATSAIRDPRSPDELNAWGYHGKLMVASGRSQQNAFASDALEVVAHEFTHSVIEAASDLSTSGEAGAIHESIADFVGLLALTHFKPEQASFVFGASIGWPLRDVLHPNSPSDPMAVRQPERYSEFRTFPIQEDLGGVHINCGIFSRFLSRNVYRSTGQTRQDGERVARFLLNTLTNIPWHSSTRMEELGAGLLASCWEMTASRPPRPGSPTGTEAASSPDVPDCSILEEELVASELLRPSL